MLKSKSPVHSHPAERFPGHSRQLLARVRQCILGTKVTDALFLTTVALPVVLLFLGRPALALLLFCPLLIGACLVAGYYDHRDDKPPAGR